MPLEKDNETHRSISNKLDECLAGYDIYDKFARPLVHGSYHTIRYLNTDNLDEWTRAKEQFSSIGNGRESYISYERHKRLKKLANDSEVPK